MKKVFVATLSITAILALFTACGNNRAGDCDSIDFKGAKISHKNPTAIIELNSTTHEYVPSLGEYTIDRNHIENPFIFTGDKSHDNDENNQSITNYNWSISHSFSSNCVDINKSASKLIFRFANTDTNDTCQAQALNNGEINVTLSVTDDEGKTDSTHKNIKTN